MRLARVVSLILSSVLVAPAAGAVVWPDVPERIDHDLASTDAAVRLAATEKLDILGPARSAPLVLRSLADPDPGVRVAAADVAARMRVAGATPLVLPWLGEHDARLRIEACAVAHAVPDSRAVGPLARALSDTDTLVRAAAAEALGVQGSPEAVPPLLGKLDDPAWTVRVELARALAELRDPRAVLPLIGKVEDPVPEVRQAVARALGDLGDPRAAPALVLQLRDASPDVHVVALASLGRVRAVDTVDAITPSVTDRSASVRHAALATLGALAQEGAADAIHVLVSRLGLDDDATMELDATPLRDALVRSGDAVVQPLRAVLRGGAAATATTSAAWVLGALQASSAEPDIVSALRRGTLPAVAALRALGGLGTPEDLPVVLEYVAHESPAVRREALRATHELLDAAHPDGRAVEPLVAVATSRRLGAAELVLVIELLGRTRAPRAATSLQAFLGSHDLSTKLAALDALGALGPAGADAAILPFVSATVPEVRIHAAEALASSGDAVARDALLDLLRDGGEFDRVAALTALTGVVVRAPSDRAVRELSGLLDHVVGGERDAVLVALVRAAPIHPLVDRLAGAPDAEDRRTVMTAAAGRPDAVPLLTLHLADPDAAVRAQAAWALGTVGGAPAVEKLLVLARTGDAWTGDAAIDAAAALARIASRTHEPAAAAALCGLVRASRPLVRANALDGLALADLRCGGGEAERAMLVDPEDRVRAAAARALVRTPRAEDAAPLATCGASDRSPEVAQACAAGHPPRKTAPARARETLVYVESPAGAVPPEASYLVELADGLVRAGTADRRGAFFDPLTPDGPLRLRLRPRPGG